MLSVIRHSMRPAVVLTLLVPAMLAMSCAMREEARQAEDTSTSATTSPPPAATVLTDANIAAIVVAANTIDIKNAQMANAKSKNQAVKAFATQMITDHTAVNQKATDLVTKLNVTPEEDATSRMLVANANATRDGIDGKEGVDFDRAYVDNEVAYHQAVIEMIDKTLIPGATNAELKALLEGVKPAFEAHLEHAKHIQAALSR